MREFTFRVDMDSASVKEIMYNSQIKRVQVLTDQGLRLDLPIGNFQRFFCNIILRIVFCFTACVYQLMN